MLRRLILIVLLLASVRLNAQVRVISPLPKGVLQVRGDRALLHFRISVPQYVQNFSVSLLSDTSTLDPFVARERATPANGWLDTVIYVPKSLRYYTLWWFADSSGQPLQGSIPGLTPGHIIGIAGQSNAQGATWNMMETPIHDVRMLRDERLWEAAHEPTGNFSGGPWIVMANVLDTMIHDSLPIGIVNAAWGGTGLLANPGGGLWTRNTAQPDDSSVYGNALRRFRASGGILECLCWIQGEAEGYQGFPSIHMYQDSFVALVQNFRSDLGDTCPVFHLQVDGLNTPLSPIAYWMQIREAHRTLPMSTLVGTSIGRPENDLHYTYETHHIVAHMFAGALLATQYGIISPFYPPLMPDTSAILDSTGIGNSKYSFRLEWHRNGVPIKLFFKNSKQYFALLRDAEFLDTSKVWSQITSDSQSVLVGLRAESIDPSRKWSMAYCAAADGDDAPLATKTTTDDTIFATGFYDLPVVFPTNADMIVSDNATPQVLDATATLFDELGILRYEKSLRAGERLDLSRDDLRPGCYWLRLQDSVGKRMITKLLIIR